MTFDTSRERLEAILAIDPRASRAEVDGRFERAFRGRGARIVLYGAGRLGRNVLHGMRCVGMEPLAFADRDPALQGQTVDGLPVLSAAEAVARHGADAVFIVTVYNNGPVLDLLERMGACHLPLSVVAWRFPEISKWWWPPFFPDGPGEHAERIRAAFALMADEASRAEFLGQLAWRSTLDRRFLPPHLPAAETYFPRDLITLGPDETFVDCGACDGDTLRAFLRHQPAGPRAFIGVEPDAGNGRKLAAFLAGRSGTARIVSAVLGAGPGETRFAQAGDMTSSVHEAGAPLAVVTLDAVLAGTAPTLIKMDIEGAEAEALEGGRASIGRHLPALAIAAYHKPEDLWEIPLRIRDLTDGYDHFIRRHADECWETVAYALPSRPAEAGSTRLRRFS